MIKTCQYISKQYVITGCQKVTKTVKCGHEGFTTFARLRPTVRVRRAQILCYVHDPRCREEKIPITQRYLVVNFYDFRQNGWWPFTFVVVTKGPSSTSWPQKGRKATGGGYQFFFFYFIKTAHKSRKYEKFQGRATYAPPRHSFLRTPCRWNICRAGQADSRSPSHDQYACSGGGGSKQHVRPCRYRFRFNWPPGFALYYTGLFNVNNAAVTTTVRQQHGYTKGKNGIKK